MGRPIRCREPDSYYLATTRCLESRFFLLPDARMNALYGYWLARSLGRFPAITLYCAVAMSNHTHLLLHDGAGLLSDFCCYFLGNLAKAVNKLRGRSGPVFHRRYDDGGRVLDVRAAVEKMAYLITNPVQSGLVADHGDWPGVLLYTLDVPTEHEFVWFDEEGWLAACRRAPHGAPPDRKRFERRASLTVRPLPFALTPQGTALIGKHEFLALDESAHELINESPKAAPLAAGQCSASRAAFALAREIEAGERAKRGQAGRVVFGVERILAQDPRDVPRETKTSPRAVCHASDERLWFAFRRAVGVFVRWYREAANRFWDGNYGVQYPPYALHPGGAPAT